MKLTPSLEDYLKTILLLEKKKQSVRVTDIAAMMDVRMPSVTEALKHLREMSLVNYKKKAFINLTDEGMKIAECILIRRMSLLRFFKDVLRLNDALAEDQACMIEHSIDHETAVRLSALTDWIEESLFEQPNFSTSEWSSRLREKIL